MSVGFGVISVLILVLFLLVSGGVAAIIVTSVLRRRRNNRSQLTTVEATVLSKYASTQQHPIGGDTSGGHGYTTFAVYQVTFMTAANEQLMLTVSDTVYATLTEGVRGQLTVQGTQFYSFAPYA